MGGGGRESGRNGIQNAKTRLEAAANSIAYFEAQTKRDRERETDGQRWRENVIKIPL